MHRPRHGDWSLPKGKLDAGEGWEEAALREVEEETGLSCRLGEELSTVRYVDHQGRDKVVRYWRMEPVAGAFEPTAEVDQLRWLSPEEAIDLLTHEGDREVVRAAAGDATASRP